MITPLYTGIAGAALLLIAFTLNQTHVWKDTDIAYDSVNLIGGVLLVIYALQIGSIPFAILNGVWAAVSIRDVIIYYSKK